jgi:hypothetical protein
MSDDWFKTHKNVTPFDILSNLVIFLCGRVMRAGSPPAFSATAALRGAKVCQRVKDMREGVKQ